MSWSYSPDFAANPKDYVRFLTGDTKPETPYLQDEEINALLQLNGNNTGLAAIAALYAICGSLTGYIDESIGGVSMQYSQILKNFTDNLTRLKTQVSMNGAYAAVAYAGGTSIADIEAREENRDRPPRDFIRDPATAADERRRYGQIGSNGYIWGSRW